MPIFKCSKCGCVENTATSRYWLRNFRDPNDLPLCSECDPVTGRWHGIFPKMSATGYLLGNDGFLYSKEELERDQLNWRMVHQGFVILNEIKE